MSTTTAVAETEAADEPEDVRLQDTRSRSFERWGLAAYLATVVLLVAAVLVWLGGRLVYVLDDPAIHLSVAAKLVDDGTWGVAAGHFESASSSPLWTLVLAVGLAVTPAGVEEWMPLVLNVLAGLAVVVVLGRSQRALAPGRQRPLDVVATVVLVVVALFLPGLAIVGMEHTLHVLLVLGAVVLVQQRATGTTTWGPPWLPYLLIALGTLTRFETAFVAAGLALGLVLADGDAGDAGRGAGAMARVRAAASARGRQIVGVVAAAAVPIVVFAVVNKAMGGGLLPNSVLAKGQGGHTGNGQNDGVNPSDIVRRLAQDPLLTVLVAVAVVYLVALWNRPAGHRVTAVTLVVASGLHAALADTGWFERYQAYLIAVGVYLVLGIVSELPEDLRRRGVVAAVLLVVALGMVKVSHLVNAPLASDDMYRHQYQAGRFLSRYYDGQPIATDQLGYISLFHDGPITDFAGLGDYEVLGEKTTDRDERRELWERLTEERGFKVAVVYDVSALFNSPTDWVLAGTFRIEGEPVTAVTRNLQVWSTSLEADDVEALLDHLADFQSELPDRMSLQINDFAGFQAASRRDRLALEALADAADAADTEPGG